MGARPVPLLAVGSLGVRSGEEKVPRMKGRGRRHRDWKRGGGGTESGREGERRGEGKGVKGEVRERGGEER